MKTIANRIQIILIISLFISVLIIACQLLMPTPTAVPVEQGTTVPASSPTAESQAAPSAPPGVSLSQIIPPFATFKEPPVATAAGVTYESTAPDLSNVTNAFILSSSQLKFLAQNGFVASPGSEKEFFTVYEKARYLNVPIFVTSDSLLHSYHLLFDKVLRTAETEHFIPLLKELNQGLLSSADQQYQELKGTDWEDAARRTVAFVGVASKLLDSNVQVPAYAADLVDGELALINAASGTLPSPIFPGLEYGEDYTQYIPRGHYTKSEELKAYFKSMMWYGRMTFRLKTKDPAVGKAETRSALLLLQAIKTTQLSGRSGMDAWMDLYRPTVFFVGHSDDLTILQYDEVMNSVYGQGVATKDLVNEQLLDTFIEKANQLPAPKILGIVIMYTDNVEAATKGLRFMGQRFVPDAYIFRQLIFRNVSTLEHRRGLPKGLDLLAAMGSERAYQILGQMDETSYENYPQQMEKARSWLAGLSVDDWTETLYNSWLYSFYPLLATPEEGLPPFAKTQAWMDKQLNTVLGSWAELKHDTILYAKQVYAELGGGPPPPKPVPPKGYVEPVPQFYARLAALTAMTREGLESRQLLGENDKASLEKLEELSLALKTMSEKELRGEPLTDDEYDRIRFYGGALEDLVMAAADTSEGDENAPKYMDEEPQAAVIADVATDPGALPEPVVLEESVGRINEIHVVVPMFDKDGKSFLQVAKGGVFSYYEFSWPASDRLTDEKWRGMLDNGQAPSLPDWTNSFFTPEGEYINLQSAINNFHSTLVSSYWYMDNTETTGVYAQFQSEIDSLRAAKRFIGKQLMSMNFASFDLQSADLAVVTAQETWQDTLYEGDLYGDNKDIAARGPYTLLVTYRLERKTGDTGPVWEVTEVKYADQPPEWVNK